MKFKFIPLFVSLLICHIALASAPVSVTGAGATFPYPLYSRWAELYEQQTQTQINYQPIGSGGGIQQIKAGTVDFGASDKPLSAAELKQNNLTQFPTVLGAVVPIINLSGIESRQLKLTGSVLADIFQGKITKWSDPAISKLNPNVKLSNQAITVVHRSDGSGTSFLFTNYLSKVSQDWATQVGSDTSVKWPVGIGAKGNEGVALYVKQISGSIGYVEYSYAVTNHLSVAQLQNKANNYVTPSIESIKAAASGANWNNSEVILTDQSDVKSWPITGATFILMPTIIKDTDKSKAVFNFFDWAYHNGGKDATALSYVMLPKEVINQIQHSWKITIKDQQGQTVWGK